MDEVFRKLFPGLSFLPRFERFLSGLELSREDLERLVAPPPGDPALPLLDLDGPEGLTYSAAAGREIIVPKTGPSSVLYSRAGLVFKVGQARQLLGEDDFNRDYVVFDLETTGISPKNEGTGFGDLLYN